MEFILSLVLVPILIAVQLLTYLMFLLVPIRIIWSIFYLLGVKNREYYNKTYLINSYVFFVFTVIAMIFLVNMLPSNAGTSHDLGGHVLLDYLMLIVVVLYLIAEYCRFKALKWGKAVKDETN